MATKNSYDRGGNILSKSRYAYTAAGTSVGTALQTISYMHFYYDAQGRPAMVDFNGTKYTYLHNLQGDIVGMLDSAGSLVVQYRYDAWGKLLATSTLTSTYTTLANLNPLRYRGYVYDTETGLYYLRSRYYSPERCRFINADSLLGKTDDVFANCVFTYCNNSPVAHSDPDGYMVAEGSVFDYGGSGSISGIPTAVAGIAGSVVTFHSILSIISDIQSYFAKGRPYINENQLYISSSGEVNTIKEWRRKNYQLHHIVAWEDKRAFIARRVLDLYDISVYSDPQNWAMVPADTHSALHTNTYYV